MVCEQCITVHGETTVKTCSKHLYDSTGCNGLIK